MDAVVLCVYGRAAFYTGQWCGLAQLVTLRDTDPGFLAHNPGWQVSGHYLGILPGGVPTGFKAERIVVGTYKRKNGKRSGELREVQRIVPDPELWDRCQLAWQVRARGRPRRSMHHISTSRCDEKHFSIHLSIFCVIFDDNLKTFHGYV
jgi:hypothetical protein